jgi:hypothetical protein
MIVLWNSSNVIFTIGWDLTNGLITLPFFSGWV